MGYTHYWDVKKKMDAETFSKFSNSCKKIAEESGVLLANGHGEVGTKPTFDDKVVRFNGVGEDAHETFSIRIEKEGFSFCKTQQKPYDEVVVACLICLRVYLGEDVQVSSDGDLEDWKEGTDLFKKVFPDVQLPLGFLNPDDFLDSENE